MLYNTRAFLLLFSLFGLACCQNQPEAAQSLPLERKAGDTNAGAPPRKTIVFFGNSLTAAYQLSPEQGFPALIQHKIDSLGLPYQCVNAGLSGETTADGKNRIDWVLQQPVDIFVLELGGNDALRGLPVTESKKNLQTIIDRVLDKYPRCKIVLAGMLAPPNLGPAYTKAFSGMYPDLAKTNRAALIPFLLDGVGGEPALNLEDGIHPNVEGHKIVAETVWTVLKPLLQDKIFK
ncbi:MAG: arylesterase [Saprospirales bacterium]|jgi:acyl-CoA thioesterase-1|nr:arylesterase [Saprospirales bacterium]MBK8921398.1 arylesterase [Saprospirales bacterium]